ncbi:MAG: hypothetical protein ACR2MK_04495 [Solirubrobacteraceae bacterium]
MGILDDAIREHLDLKRRRGADPTEVERAEREALGPVRRAPEAAASDELTELDSSVQEAGLAYDYEDEEEEGWSYESLEDEPALAEPPLAEPVLAETEVAELDDDPFAEPEPNVAPEPEVASEVARSPASPAPHPAGGETIEYDVEEALGPESAEEAGDGEDVLEETPEFLQDTPDHDRLWFEQRPPKDFDFDG